MRPPSMRPPLCVRPPYDVPPPYASASNNQDLKHDFGSSPVMRRLAIYRVLGFVHGDLIYKQDADPNAVNVGIRPTAPVT